MKRIASSLALALTMLVSATATAAVTTYRSTMSGPGESPPNASPGAGIAMIVIDDLARTLSLSMPFSALLGGAVAAHLHCCTAEPLIGSAPIAIPFNDFPFGQRSGSYWHVFNLADAATYTPAFLSAHGGTADAASTFLLNGITANEAYLNIHTPNYPAGEIRGFLVALAVPEPASWLMFGVGLAGLGLYARRKQGAG